MADAAMITRPKRFSNKETAMGKFIHELIELICQEEEILKQFLSLLNLQKQYLLANQVDRFQGTVQQQEALVDQIKALEERRIAKVKQLADSQGLREDEITLTHLIEITLGDISDELKGLKGRLSRLVEKIRRANRVNEMLIKQSLNLIQQSIDWMIDASDFTRVYDPNGRTARNTGTSVMVNKIL